nr:unnamed protein product [Callosobruchus analis]
MCVHVRPQM